MKEKHKTQENEKEKYFLLLERHLSLTESFTSVFRRSGIRDEWMVTT